jgi:hypothetical protein
VNAKSPRFMTSQVGSAFELASICERPTTPYGDIRSSRFSAHLVTAFRLGHGGQSGRCGRLCLINQINVHIYMCICICTYIYIYMHI